MTRRIFYKTKEDSVTGLAVKNRLNKQQVKGKSESQWTLFNPFLCRVTESDTLLDRNLFTGSEGK
jgi:hypothetical protein